MQSVTRDPSRGWQRRRSAGRVCLTGEETMHETQGYRGFACFAGVAFLILWARPRSPSAVIIRFVRPAIRRRSSAARRSTASTASSATAPTRAAATAGPACCARRSCWRSERRADGAGRPRPAGRGMPKFALTDDADRRHRRVRPHLQGRRLRRVAPEAAEHRRRRREGGRGVLHREVRACHSTTGDLRGIATKIADPRLLQQTWLMPGSGAGRGGPPPVHGQADHGHRDAAVG